MDQGAEQQQLHQWLSGNKQQVRESRFSSLLEMAPQQVAMITIRHSMRYGGIAANGLASTPYNVATGGTDFLDTAEGANNVYWSKTNSATGKSAKSYIPETPWNDSCAGSILFGFYGYPNGVDVLQQRCRREFPRHCRWQRCSQLRVLQT